MHRVVFFTPFSGTFRFFSVTINAKTCVLFFYGGPGGFADTHPRKTSNTTKNEHRPLTTPPLHPCPYKTLLYKCRAESRLRIIQFQFHERGPPKTPGDVIGAKTCFYKGRGGVFRGKRMETARRIKKKLKYPFTYVFYVVT